MNNVSLIGRITHDLELKADAEGHHVRFGIAINRGDNVDFLNIVAFDKIAESLCAYQGKGSQVGVSGRISTGEYTNDAGAVIKTYSIIAHRIDFLDSKKEEEQADIPVKRNQTTRRR